jgi:hypothetical protein
MPTNRQREIFQLRQSTQTALGGQRPSSGGGSIFTAYGSFRITSLAASGTVRRSPVLADATSSDPRF